MVQLQKLMEQGVAEGLLHGMVVAVGRTATPDLFWAGGAAAVQPTVRPMTPDAIFDVASITKAVACSSACGVLIDSGRLDPEAAIHHYLPDLPRHPGSEIRVCDLASHTSGFSNEHFKGLPYEEMMRLLLTAPTSWPPRSKYCYACRNFVLLGLIVEQITGEPLDVFCQRNIFDPAGMADSFGYPPPAAVQDRVVPGIYPQPVPDLNSMCRRAGRMLGHAGLYTTALDLSRFSKMMLDGGRVGHHRILGEAALGWLTKPCSPAGVPARAFGWDMRPPLTNDTLPDGDNGTAHSRPRGLSPSAYGHAGYTGQSLWIDPEAGRYAMVLTNRTHCPGRPDNQSLSGRFRARVMEAALAEVGPG